MKKKQIVFLGSKPIGYDCLAYLLEQAEELNISVLAVRTQQRKEFQQDKNLETLAKDFGVPLLASLEELPECDFIYSVQHHELLKKWHLEKARNLAVNLHLAPLPEYRGCNQFSFALMDEVAEFGVTLHEIDTRIDHGDVLFESRFPIPKQMWVQDLYDLTVKKGFELFKSSLPPLLAEDFQKVPQATLIEKYGGSLHYRDEIQELKIIDLNETKEQIEKRIRATYMPGFEPPYCLIGGEKFFFEKAK